MLPALLRYARLESSLHCVRRHVCSRMELPWTLTRYNAVSVELSDHCFDDFPELLAGECSGCVSLSIWLHLVRPCTAHLRQWRDEGRSSVWLTLPLSLTPLIPTVAELGFSLHHTKGSNVVLSCWLQENKTNRLPPYASHQVGVCGRGLTVCCTHAHTHTCRYRTRQWSCVGNSRQAQSTFYFVMP